jgi:hypothetical protein
MPVRTNPRPASCCRRTEAAIVTDRARVSICRDERDEPQPNLRKRFLITFLTGVTGRKLSLITVSLLGMELARVGGTSGVSPRRLAAMMVPESLVARWIVLKAAAPEHRCQKVAAGYYLAGYRIITQRVF